MTAATLAFHLYGCAPELRRDFDIIIRCGYIQQRAAADGRDTPAGWFAQAAQGYPPFDDLNRLARRACELVSSGFASGVPS